MHCEGLYAVTYCSLFTDNIFTCLPSELSMQYIHRIETLCIRFLKRTAFPCLSLPSIFTLII